MKDVSSQTGIPLRTLRRHKNEDISDRIGRRAVMSPELELELRDYIVACCDRFYGLTRTQARKLAADFAKANGLCVPSNWVDKGMAGDDWLTAFQNRNGLSLRSPEATSMARANGFNKDAVELFFHNLCLLTEKFKFGPGRILNLDETGITNVSACPKVLAQRGRKQVGQITSAERGSLVTVVGCIANDGNSIPPILLFPRQRVPPATLGHGSPPGSLILNSPNGWMTSELFAKEVLPHIIHNTHASQSNPILLILDNHVSHVSLEAVRLCRDKGVHLLTFPPHCSHRLQPLDVTVYGPFKTAYKRAIYDHHISNPGKCINIYQMAQIFCRAYDNSFTRKNILRGFEVTGITPVNRDIFNDEDYTPSTVFLPSESHNESLVETRQVLDSTQQGEPSTEPGQNEACSSRSCQRPTPESLRPLPQTQINKTKTSRKRGRSKILTSTPEMSTIEENHQMRLNKISKIRHFPSIDRPNHENSAHHHSPPSNQGSSEDLERQELIQHLINVQNNIKYDSFYAVQYDRRYYVGRVDSVKCQLGKRSVNFFARDREIFKWPIRRDIDQVHVSRFIYGPIEIEGHDPFRLNTDPIDSILRKVRSFFPEGIPEDLTMNQ